MNGAIVYDRFQGDPRIFITADGAEIRFRSGNPIMDPGFENAFILSLFVLPGWYGNNFLREPEKKLESRFELQAKEPITRTSLIKLEQIARESVQWFIDKGIMKSIDVLARNLNSDILDVRFTCFQPGDEEFIFDFQRNGPNWILQTCCPAHQRI